MALRNDPFREMERLFEAATRQAPAHLGMPLDLFRSGEKFVARIDLPGVDPSTIDIDIEDRTLTIRAQRPVHQGENVQWLSRERPTGTFARQLTLGHGVATDRVDASYDDGVLELTIPVAEEAKPRKIQVSHGSDARTIDAAPSKDSQESENDENDSSSD